MHSGVVNVVFELVRGKRLERRRAPGDDSQIRQSSAALEILYQLASTRRLAFAAEVCVAGIVNRADDGSLTPGPTLCWWPPMFQGT